MNKKQYIETLKNTENIDGTIWRLLPQTVVTDLFGRHWIPENFVLSNEEVAAQAAQGKLPFLGDR